MQALVSASQFGKEAAQLHHLLPTYSPKFQEHIHIYVCPVLSIASFGADTSCALHSLYTSAALQSLGKLVGKHPGEKRKMKILKGVSGALKPVSLALAQCKAQFPWTTCKNFSCDIWEVCKCNTSAVLFHRIIAALCQAAVYAVAYSYTT